MLLPSVEVLATPEAPVWAFVLGIMLHVFFLRVGEWDLATVRLIVGFWATIAGLSVCLWLRVPQLQHNLWSSSKTAIALGSSLLAGMYASMLVYRAAFHRLGRFPGPFAARLSNLWITGKSIQRQDKCLVIQDLHRKYGDIVRIGPSELSIVHAAAPEAIHANRTTCVKGPWYNILYPLESLQMIRNKDVHSVRRKTWDRAFGSKALRDYEPRVKGYTAALVQQIDARLGQPVNVTEWFNNYSFDVMSDLAFGKSFGLLASGGKRHYFTETLHADMGNVGRFSHVPWLFPVFKAMPVLNAENKKFWAFVTALVDERIQNPPKQPDVFSWLLEDYQALPHPTAQDRLNLQADAHLICVAGSDTTAASLTCLFFELVCHPDAAARLQAEIDDYYAGTPEAGQNHLALSKLEYLQACIDEALRLHPAVPGGVQRLTAPQGLQIGEHHIPGSTVVQIPTHTINRDARFFAEPDEFIPERWTSRKDLAIEPSVFVPFSTGRYSCVGRQLGLMELRTVTSELMRRYDFRLVPGQDPQDFARGKVDAFTLACAPLQVVFTPREQAK
ncbi:hypothetical protein SCUCBS95973_009004 [Sporothrix curviconia]|uniref:Uncharacterized protein n=1 Tax=Sporothrix curviconia TaxID=1260050 RepID=A0ABP0CRD5_9PEZI